MLSLVATDSQYINDLQGEGGVSVKVIVSLYHYDQVTPSETTFLVTISPCVIINFEENF